jgi:hypothetical protein
MKLSNDTLTILKNFANINAGLEFRKGNKLATISPSKTVLAKTTLADQFPEDFCVHDLNEFLSVHSLYKDPVLDFDDVNVVFRSGRNKTNYRKTSKTAIVTVPEKELSLPTVEVSFTLKEEDFQFAMKTSSVLKSPNIAIESDGKKVYLSCFNAVDNGAHTNSTEIADGNGNEFKAVFSTENWKMIPGTYNVEISSKGLALFKSANMDLQYWIAVEAKYSKFGG